MNNTKVAIAASKTVAFIQMFAGVFFVLTFGVCTLVYLADSEYRAEVGFAFLVLCLLFDALGIWLIRLSRNRNKLIKEFKKYVPYISADPTGSIDNIAVSMNASVDVVKSNLELMIERNYFANARIDANTNCIIIGSNRVNNVPSMQPNMQQANVQQANVQQANVQQSAPQVQMIPVTCKCCGGMNKIAKGVVSECDFCGSPIKG